MKTYYIYLKETKGFSHDTSRYMNNLASEYLQWLEDNDIKLKKANYKILLNYIGYLQTQHKSKHNINYRLKTIACVTRLAYRWL